MIHQRTSSRKILKIPTIQQLINEHKIILDRFLIKSPTKITHSNLHKFLKELKDEGGIGIVTTGHGNEEVLVADVEEGGVGVVCDG